MKHRSKNDPGIITQLGDDSNEAMDANLNLTSEGSEDIPLPNPGQSTPAGLGELSAGQDTLATTMPGIEMDVPDKRTANEMDLANEKKGRKKREK